MAKKLSIEAEMRAAQREMKKKLSGEDEEEVKKVKKKAKPVKEQYKEIRESLKEKDAPKEIAFKDNYEEELIRELFKGDITVSQALGKENAPEQPKREKSGLWDYVLEDEIKFFDPECSYELTGYKPITETKGLDFNPEWFTEAARTYTETGKYTEYPAGSKPYADYWNEQIRRCKEGYKSHGYRITGDNYFFLNFYRMQTVQHSSTAGKGRIETFPSFHAKQYEFFHYVEMAEKLRKDICALKARGLGFSELIASLLVRPYTTNKGYVSMLTAPDKPKLDNTKNKCWLQLNWLDTNTNGGMRHVRMKINNDDRKRASKVNSENIEYGWMSEIQTVIADTADKIRGSRVDRLVFEECFGEGTKVIMSDYSRKNIEDVRIGDFVMGIDGSPQEVIKTCSGYDQLYLVKQKRGDSYIINSKHKLYLRSNLHGKINVGKISCADYLALPQWRKERMYGLKCTGLEFNNDFDLDPYFFGLWLGDGFKRAIAIIINETDDIEISNYVNWYFSTIPNTHITKRISSTVTHKHSNKALYNYYLAKNKGHKNIILDRYKELNLINNKHIPKEIYFTNIDYRLKVLAGIIDTDGNLKTFSGSNTYSYEIAMSNKKLIYEIIELARSCGFYVNYNEHIMNQGFKIGSNSYRVNITGDIYRIPVKINRKKTPFNYKRRYNALYTNIQVTPAYYGKYYGFTLKSYNKPTDNLFLTDDYTIQSNCGSNAILTKSWIQSNALVELGGEHFGSRICIGTAGDDMKLDGLSTIFSNPEGYNVLPYKNYDTEDLVPTYTSYFIPAHKFALLPEYLDNRGVTDSKRFKEFYENERKKLSGKDLFNYCAEHPFHPQEALFKQGENYFDSVLIADRLTQLRIQKVGVKPQRVDLLWDVPKGSENNPRNKVKLIPNAQGKVFIYEPPLRDGEGNLYKNLYIAGIDSIDQGTADSSTNNDVSDFCIVIKKRILGSNSSNYVAIYKDRPRDIATAYENAMKLCVYYNCKAMLEHTKISIIMYFRSKKKDNLFMKRPKSTMPDIRKGNSGMIGYPATETYLRHGLELISRFVDESCYSIQIDEMLEQLLKYSWENKRKFDIVAAMIAAELGDEDLLGFTPRAQDEVRNSWKDFGWYYDSNGQKRYGIIPS